MGKNFVTQKIIFELFKIILHETIFQILWLLCITDKERKEQEKS